MSDIRFSHNYPKLWGQTTAQLIAVRLLSSKQFNSDLIEYDTKFEGGYYPLTEGDYLQLIFWGNKAIPFCTIRPYTPQKKQYYMDSINKIFNIVVKE